MLAEMGARKVAVWLLGTSTGGIWKCRVNDAKKKGEKRPYEKSNIKCHHKKSVTDCKEKLSVTVCNTWQMFSQRQSESSIQSTSTDAKVLCTTVNQHLEHRCKPSINDHA